MSLSLSNTIPVVSLSGNPVKAIVNTTSRYSVVPRNSKLSFAFADASLVENNTVKFVFETQDAESITITYTYKATPSAAREFSSYENFYLLIRTDIEINRYYVVSKLPGNSILLESRVNDECFNITFTSQVSGTSYNNYTSIAATEKAFYIICCNVWVLDYMGMPGLSLAGTLVASPDTNNQVVFDVASLLENNYQSEFSYPNTDFIKVRNNMRTIYKLEFFERYISANVEIKEGYLETGLYYALAGKISDELLSQYEGLNTTWWEQYCANKNFLTWQPLRKAVFADQPEKLYHICYGNHISVRLRAKLYYTDNTNATIDVSDPTAVNIYDVVEVNACYNDAILPNLNPAKTLSWWELYLDTPNSTATEKKSYTLETRYFNKQRTFMFRNALGAYDCMVFAGIFSQDNKYERNIIQLENSYKEQGVIPEKTYSGNSQYLQSKEFKLWLQEFFTSPEVCEIDGSVIYGVVLLDEKQKLWQDRQNMHDISFEYMRSVIDSLFTPLDIVITIDGLAYSDEGFFSPAEDEIFGTN